MAKAHEDKLKAIKQIEEKKNAEIETLKQELKALKSAPGALTTTTSPAPLPAGLDVNSMTKEQLAQKLFAYQQFMAKYIVDAQVQKTKAVLAAENAMKQKYDEKLRLLSSSSSPSATTTEITPSTPTTTSVAFQERSAKVSAAAAAGKSRWGDLENEKASKVTGGVKSAGAPVNGAVAPSTITLPSPSVATAASSTRAFDERNAMVAAAGQAGKSRWGEMEVAKATQAAAAAKVALPASSTPASTVPAASVPTITIPVQVPPEVEAADHGLRADGGVGGPSLAERVNFGARLLQGSVPAPLANTRAPSTASSASSSSIYYNKRNAMVLAAAKAGKSRWGEMEVQRVQSLVGALPAGSPLNSPVKVTPEIEAADHGLRADGGVGGPSLAQRVNFGAALLGQ